MDKSGLSEFTLHIAGSITSNQFSDRSDVDLHFCVEGMAEDEVEDLNGTIRKEFDESYPEDRKNIGSHKIEIYFQSNPFQDMMSIGCYDFFKKEWLVGPEIIPQDYDPYSEYYNDDMKYVNSVIEDIRNVILEVYETLLVLNSTRDREFTEYEYNALKDKLAKAALIFTKARECRKVYSSPTSKEDALTKRTSREWKVADSAFKLLDKFGYLGILRECTRAWEQIQSGEATVEQIIPNLIQAISNNVTSNPLVQNVDKELFENLQDESMVSSVATILTIASMIAIPGVTNARTLERELKNIPRQSFNIKNKAVTNAVNKSAMEKKSYGGWSYSNLTNLIATLAYNEGMLDYIKPNAKGKKYDDRVLQAIIWTVINRAGGDVNKFAEKILEPSQYFGVSKIKNRTAKTYTIQHPGVGYNKKTWDKCNELAVLAIKGTLPKPKDDNGVDFGTRNMIANKAKDNATAYKNWGSKCDFTIGGSTKHYYGYDKSHDGYGGKSEKKTYTIKRGDNLIAIAKSLGTTKEDLLSKNPQIKNQDKIFIGQKIFI